QTSTRAIDGSGSNMLIDHNTIHDVGWAITLGGETDRNVRVSRNDIYNIDHGLVLSFGASGGSTGPYFFNDNRVHDYAAWDWQTTANGEYHHDGIHCYTTAGGLPKHITDLYIYDNRFFNMGHQDSTAQVFIEGGSGPGTTPCADQTSNIWLFN